MRTGNVVSLNVVVEGVVKYLDYFAISTNSDWLRGIDVKPLVRSLNDTYLKLVNKYDRLDYKLNCLEFASYITAYTIMKIGSYDNYITCKNVRRKIINNLSRYGYSNDREFLKTAMWFSDNNVFELETINMGVMLFALYRDSMNAIDVNDAKNYLLDIWRNKDLDSVYRSMARDTLLNMGYLLSDEEVTICSSHLYDMISVCDL